MKKTLTLLALSLTLGCRLSAPATAASTDIVPRGSALLDAFATLARTDALGAANTPEDFLGEPLYTRGQLARMLEGLVQDTPDQYARVQKDKSANVALQAAIAELGPELKTDGVDLTESDDAPAETNGSLVSGYVSPEVRLRTGGDSRPGTGAIGIYRITAQGSLQSNVHYVVSGSNWAEDQRRVFNNDIGAHDFSGLNQAYLQLDGGRGLKVSLGRMYDRWGPGYRGTTLISDNAPAFDQLELAFPFSLGAIFGRDYRFDQFVTTFQENGTRKYLSARRLEGNFGPRLSASFEEAFKSNSTKSLEIVPFPDFYEAQSSKILKFRGLDEAFNAFVNFGLSYAVTPDTRFYGQFGIDDIQSPGRQPYRTPRKIAYLIGTAFQPAPGTNVVAEYTFADPTTYTSRDLDTQWQKGQFNQIGLPTGPNSQEVFLRLSHKVSPGLTLALQGRDRRRHNDAFPTPNSRDIAATVEYSPNKKSGIELTYHDYRQEAFPLSPTIVLSGDGFTPANAEGYYGQNLRIQELDVAYRLFF